MTLLQFDNVGNDKMESLSFSIEAGETRILEVLTQGIKLAVIDMALGELQPANGVVSLKGQPLALIQPGKTGWVPAEGGLISNLKVWENITLPLWYHGNRQLKDTEESVMFWLSALNVDEKDWERFVASPVARLNTLERKLAGLLRGLLLAPQVLIIDGNLFEEVDKNKAGYWIKALEKFARDGDDGRAVLVVANTSTLLPWKLIE